jgi:poly-gamma-glutamate capsule biosynthesis protein CapA/YwtB (metallophosphatase superfamily)
MESHYGWSLDGAFGRFMAVSTVVLAVGAIVLSTASVIEKHFRQSAAVPSREMRQAMKNVVTPPPGAKLWLSPKYKPGDRSLVDVVAAGDVMMGSADAGLNPAIKPHVDAAALIGVELASIFRHADASFVNLEGPFYDGSKPTAKVCDHCISFRSPSHYADVLTSLHVSAVSLANNHSGDYGEAGLDSTLAVLSARGIKYGGLDRDGARVAILHMKDGRDAALIAFSPNSGTLDINDIAAAQEFIRSLKETHSLVLVSFHGGGEGWERVHVVDGEETFAGEGRGNVVAFAHAAVSAGADLVVGHGPHVPRAVEIYKHHLIAYSLGNFWTYEGVMTYAVSGLGPVLEAWLAPDGSIAGFTIHSTRQAGLGVPHLDPEDEAARYVYYLTRTDFPRTADQIDKARRSNSGS